MIKYLSGENFRFENLCLPHGLASCVILKDFSDDIGGDINECNFKKLYIV